MFFCGAQTLYYTKVELDSLETLEDNEIISLKQLLKNNTNQLIMPKIMEVPNKLDNYTLGQRGKGQQKQFKKDSAQYRFQLSEQTRQFKISELTKDPSYKLFQGLFQDQQEQLHQGDSFLLDRAEFQIYLLPNYAQILFPTLSHTTQTEDRCRICFGDDTNEINPLLNFCDCSGSIRYMHLECCREWIKDECLQIDQYAFTLYAFKKITCNICKQPWRKTVLYNKRKYFLYDYSPDHNIDDYRIYQSNSSELDKNYLLFEMKHQDAVFLDNQDKQYPCVLILKVKLSYQEQTYLKIGNSEEQCDIYLGFLKIIGSVKCQIIWKNNKLYVKNLSLQNETLITIHNLKNNKFSNKDGLTLKYNNTFLHIKSKNSIFSCFQSLILYNVKYEKYKQKKITKMTKQCQ